MSGPALRPPAAAERLLGWALGDSEAARSIRGDLNEDFARAVERVGEHRARLWYWREALALSGSSVVGRGPSHAPPRPARAPGDGDRRAPRPIGSHRASPGLAQDTRYALRAIRRDPGFFAFAVAVIGLGVGASTAVYSVVSPLLIEPLPFDEPDRLVWIANGTEGGLSGVTSRSGNLRDFRELARSFDGLSGFNAFFDQGSYNLVGVGEPERLVGAGVAHDFLDVLGVPMAVGRGFTLEEGVWEGRPAMILTHGYWQRRFAGDPSIVGTRLVLNDVPHEVVGVLPAHFDFSSVFAPTTPVDILVPFPISAETDRWGNMVIMVGRLRPGVTVEAAQADLEAVMAGLAEADPQRWGLGANVYDLQERVSRPFRSALLLLSAAAGLVMLIVCVNLSNMLLARSPRRQKEMAVRRTLGATRGRLVRQLLLESLVVSLAGAVLGVAVARAAVGFVTRTGGLDIPMLASMSVDGAALVFTAGVALFAGVAVGVLPALQVSEGGEAEAMGGSSRGGTSSRRAGRLRELLVVSEVAMACMLLVFGGLVLRSFQRVMEVDLGFEPAGIAAWRVNTTQAFESRPAMVAFYDELVAAVEAVPGVQAASLTDALPLGRNRTWTGGLVGVEYERGQRPYFFPHVVDWRYTETMGIRLVEGRYLGPDDTHESAPVALVSETAVRTMGFPGGSAVGHFLDLWYGEVEVVGVVADVKHRALELGGDPEVYFAYAQNADFNTFDLVVRTDLPPSVIAPSVAEAIRGVDADMPTTEYETLDGVVERSVSPRRFTLQLLGAFAATALLLAALGIYGVLSYSVTERLPEIGIRMALGESAGDVRRRLVGRTLTLAAIGIAIGTAGAVVGTRYMASLLYGVEPTDPVTFGTMIAVLLASSALSGLLPAIRASRTDSARALRAT